MKTREEWYSSFEIEGLENVQRDYNDNRYINTPVHGYARDWIRQKTGKNEKKDVFRFALGTTITILTVVVGYIAWVYR